MLSDAARSVHLDSGMDSFRETLKKLRADFARRVPEKVENLAQLVTTLERNPEDRGAWTELHRVAHNLTGSGPTYGFSRLGVAAHAISEVAHQVLQGASVANVIVRLRDLLVIAKDASRTQEEAEPLSDPSSWRTPNARPVYVVDDDEDFAASLATQLEIYGFEVKKFTRLDAMAGSIERDAPFAVILDVVFDGGERGTAFARAMHLADRASTHVLFCSQHADLAERLDAVRSGGAAYFSKPVDLGAIVEHLDRLSSTVRPDAMSIMIVDDDRDALSHYATMLRANGIRTVTKADAHGILEAIAEHQPDLVLLDHNLVGCSGLEIAAILRQDERFAEVPIVFLSAAPDSSRMIAAYALGADDYLPKSTPAELLVASLRARIERSRVLRARMDRDSLTGLLNHRRIKAQLDREVAWAQRYQRPLSLAMIDIDHFKTVNDRYGHSTGDYVLKSLAALLRKRLRKTDFIGRPGGEEFAVLLPDTPSRLAVEVIERIRHQFAEMAHGPSAAHVTFTAGLASFPDSPSASLLWERADNALYEGKSAGRNRVIASEPTDMR